MQSPGGDHSTSLVAATRDLARSRVLWAVAWLAAVALFGLSPAPAAAERVTREFVLAAGSQTPVATGIQLTEGSPAELQISGNAKCGAGADCPEGSFGGSGQTCGGRELGALNPGPAGPAIPYGAAAARIGAGSWSVITPGATIAGKGELQLVYNDCEGYYGDNSGSFLVKVAYTPLATIAGQVADDRYKPAPGVTLKLAGTSDEGTAVSQAVTSSASGGYSFEVPKGKYEVTASGEMSEQYGGKLSVALEAPTIGAAAPSSPAKPECAGSASGATCALNHIEIGEQLTANFTYTYCAAAERAPNGKPPTSCPIIFIPGFLGSRLKCATGEVWTNIPNPDFEDMALQPDGITDAGAPGSCASTVEAMSGQEGVVATAAGKDIYGQTLAYLNRILPGRVYAYPYDWRKSPLRAVPDLNAEVDKVISASGASRVVLMAHSMGGLVTQAYISNPEYAKKVIRAITLGTPYWGAPKSHTALLSGKSAEPVTEWFGLDLLIDARQAFLAGAENHLQFAARNMQGLYWLYPDSNFGPWLSVYGESFSSAPKGAAGIDPWISLLGGAPSLLDSAVAGHGTLDGFKTNEVDYRVLVGVGTPTITSMQIEPIPFTAGEAAQIEFGSGDGTVPARSATQGAFESGTPLGNDVPISTACFVDHVALPGNAGVQGRIEGFLLKGEAVRKAASEAEEVCPYSGKQWEVLGIGTPKAGASSSSAAPKIAIVTPAGASLSVGQAVEQELVQSFQQAGKTIIVADSHNPVTLKLVGRGVRVKVRSLSEHKGNFGGSGRPLYYGPVSGTLTLSETGAVRRNGKPLRAARPAHLPHTIARVIRHGRRFTVRLIAKPRTGVAATYIRIGKAAAHRYRKPLRLSAKQLKRLRFASVDRFGDWERQKKVAARR